MTLHRRHRPHHARQRLDRLRDVDVVGQRRIDRGDEDVTVHADDLVEKLRPEAVHHREHDDQGRHAQHDADERESGDDRDEALAPPGAQIAPGEHPLEAGEGFRPAHLRHTRPPVQALSRAVTSPSGRSSRSPVLRRLSSSLPSAKLFGPTITCQGRPIKSALANFAPGRSSRSS